MAKADTALQEIAAEAAGCRRCPLYRVGTQTVFGQGPASAPLVFVGEQPGDREDLAGLPFVGPAGRILDAGLAASGIDRTRVYVTNAVKHFKNVPRGKRRIHQRPNTYEIDRCRWWLDQPVSNSARLRTMMLELAAERGWDWEVELLPDPDAQLSRTDEVVFTADAAILDTCHRWHNLAAEIVAAEVPDAWVVDFRDA